MREITVYEETDPDPILGYKDHVGRITVFEINQHGGQYDLRIVGEEPTFVFVNGKLLHLVEDGDE